MKLLFLLYCSKNFNSDLYYAPLVKGERATYRKVWRGDSLDLTGNAEGIPPPLRGPPPFDKGGFSFVQGKSRGVR